MLSTAERAYHTGQYEAPYRSTGILRDFVASTAGTPLAGTVMDVGCGAGANLFWFRAAGLTDGVRALGVDADPELIAIARQHNRADRYEVHDFLAPLPAADYVFSIQVLSFIEDWRPALARLLKATRQRLYVTSLFWDGVSTHTHATDAGHSAAHYNVIDAYEFAAACPGREIRWLSFLSDLAKYLPSGKDRLGSYTAGWHDFSGPLHLPWRAAMIRTGPS